jgi:hypothetical protein
MTTQWNANYIETMPFSDTCFQVGCTVNSAQTVTIPGTDTMQYQALFEYASNSNVFVGKNAVPVIPPGGSVGTQTYNEFKPLKRYVRGGDVLHLITPDATAYIGVTLRQIQG